MKIMKSIKLMLAIAAMLTMLGSCNKEVEEQEAETSTENTSGGSSNSTTSTNSSNSSSGNNSNGATTGSSSINYELLKSAQETIDIGGTTEVVATATGEGLSYNWSTTSGDIIGYGSTITYGASGCCGGNNTVTCIVKDSGNHQESKSITIVVQ